MLEYRIRDVGGGAELVRCQAGSAGAPGEGAGAPGPSPSCLQWRPDACSAGDEIFFWLARSLWLSLRALLCCSRIAGVMCMLLHTLPRLAGVLWQEAAIQRARAVAHATPASYTGMSSLYLGEKQATAGISVSLSWSMPIMRTAVACDARGVRPRAPTGSWDPGQITDTRPALSCSRPRVRQTRSRGQAPRVFGGVWRVQCVCTKGPQGCAVYSRSHTTYVTCIYIFGQALHVCIFGP